LFEQATKNSFVVSDFVAVTKPFFSAMAFKQRMQTSYCLTYAVGEFSF